MFIAVFENTKLLTILILNAMTKTITFNELRRVKDALPSGSMTKIAAELGLEKETVRNYFGGHDYKDGKSCGVHIEPGPDGGLVMLDDTQILDIALSILETQKV
jgi:AcrR family transcriptional regulator